MKHLKTYKIFETLSLSDMKNEDFDQLEVIIKEMLIDLTDKYFNVKIHSYYDYKIDKILVVDVDKEFFFHENDIVFGEVGYKDYTPFLKNECIDEIKEFINRVSSDFNLVKFWISHKNNNFADRWKSNIDLLYQDDNTPLNYIRMEFF
jgi:hypothetical protein